MSVDRNETITPNSKGQKGCQSQCPSVPPSGTSVKGWQPLKLEQSFVST